MLRNRQMDKYLEIGRKIRITSFDNPEETVSGTILNFNSSEIVIEFEFSQSLSFIEKNRDKIFDISLINPKNLVKFSSSIININIKNSTILNPSSHPEFISGSHNCEILKQVQNDDKNIVTIKKPSDFQIIQRREYTRVNMKIPVTFFDKNGNSFNCVTTNVSGGGMQVSSPCSLALGVSFEVEIKFKNNTVKAFFEVLRIEKNVQENQYFLAGMFKKIQNVDRIYLIQSCFKKQLESRYTESN
jgi:hypothetical protein